MSYVDIHLLKDEIDIYRTILHWRVFIIPVIFVVMVLAMFMLTAAKVGCKPVELLFSSFLTHTLLEDRQN